VPGCEVLQGIVVLLGLRGTQKQQKHNSSRVTTAAGTQQDVHSSRVHRRRDAAGTQQQHLHSSTETAEAG